jgi:hypothetical protein
MRTKTGNIGIMPPLFGGFDSPHDGSDNFKTIPKSLSAKGLRLLVRKDLFI